MPFDHEKDTFLRRLRTLPAALSKRIQPEDRNRKVASITTVSVVVVLAAVIGGSLNPGFGPTGDRIAGTLLAVIVVALSGIVSAWVLRFLYSLPRFLGWLGVQFIIGLTVALLTLLNYPLWWALTVGVGVGIFETLFVTHLHMFFTGQLRDAETLQRRFSFVVIVVGIGTNLFVISWLRSPGYDDHLRAYEPPAVAVSQIDAPDPSSPGPYEVAYLTYGSGTDRQRAEFGSDVDIVVESVDVTPFTQGRSGWRSAVRNRFWGFDLKEAPLNARVWYPEGDGPFPLVLIVHGNHEMTDFSDEGYGYLGELLASRGYIIASVDENFLNWGITGNLKVENDCRAWVLLKHLQVWRDWSEDRDSMFFEKIDLDNIGLMGHSRGGEAVAIAASFNRLTRYPDDATVEFDFDFNINAVIAIAPVDGQYKPSNMPTPLKDVNYFVIHGGHDGDVSDFQGDRQYNRIQFSENSPTFKSSLYIYRANHGQFNTSWGNTDFSFPASLQLNVLPLLDGEDQRQIAKVYFSAFLEATLKGDDLYRALFEDYRTGLDWLPDDYYINRYRDASHRTIADFGEDIDVTTATLPGVILEGKNLTVWKEQHSPTRYKSTKEDSAVYLGWKNDGDETASYSITISDAARNELNLVESWEFCFSAVPTLEKPEEEDFENDPANFSIEFQDRQGESVSVPINRFRAMLPVLPSRYRKFRKEESMHGTRWEPALQSFRIPSTVLQNLNPVFNPELLREIRFVFDQSPDGLIILDEIGITHEREPTS